MNAAALRPEAFEARYQGGADPWLFAQSPYEQGRYQAIVEALERARYLNAYEPGCSVGVLTEQLAARCAHIAAIDFAPSAIAQAQQRCAHLSHVDILCRDLEDFVPMAPDLIVFSEVGYYFSEDKLGALASKLSDRLVRGGEFIAAHWLGHSPDHLLHGTQVQDILHDHLQLRPMKSQLHDGFCLDSWIKA